MSALSRAAPPSLVSVVIPAHNAADVIGEQLGALAVQSFIGRFEVVVVDNRSSDALDQVVEGFRDRLEVRIVTASERAGVSHARNVGCAAACGELLAICDADDIVEQTWLDELVQVVRHADLVGGPLETSWVNPQHTQRWRVVPASSSLPVRLSLLPYAHGCNLALWRRVFDAIGGWDEQLVGGGDDIDFCWRAQLAGFNLMFAPKAVVHYRLRDNVSATMKQVADYSAANALLLKRYRAAGARPTAMPNLLREVNWLLTRAPYLFLLNSWRRGRWLVRLAFLWGRIRGSARHRIWAL